MPTPGFRDFLKKLIRSKHLNYRSLALEMGTPQDILDQRVKQFEHFFEEGGGEPRAGFAKAIEEALGVCLEAHDYGWDPSKP